VESNKETLINQSIERLEVLRAVLILQLADKSLLASGPATNRNVRRYVDETIRDLNKVVDN